MGQEGYNRWSGIGTLGADPELRITAGGVAVLKIRMACNETYVHEGKRTEKTEWVSVSIWNKRGEALSKFLRKGDRVFISGPLSTSSWEKEGQKHYRTEIRANEVVLLSPKGSRDHEAAPSTGGGDIPDDGGAFGGGMGSDDDIPFIIDETRRGST